VISGFVAVFLVSFQHPNYRSEYDRTENQFPNEYIYLKSGVFSRINGVLHAFKDTPLPIAL
jgi:hypothetical protein